MALSREYRIREVYLRFLEENFSQERTKEFRAILGDSENRLLNRLSLVNDAEDEARNAAVFNAYVYSLFEAYTRRRQQISSLKELKRFSHHYTNNTESAYPRNRSEIAQALSHCKLWALQEEKEANELVTSIALFQEFLNSLHSTTLAEFSASLKGFVANEVSAQLDETPYMERVRLFGQLIQTSTDEVASQVEAVRLALQCMPVGDQKGANIFLYLAVKVFGIWPEASPRLLHVPVDNDLSRVLLRIGVTQRKLGNSEYGAIGYAAIQALAKRLAPDDPSALYGLKRISKRWCRSRSTDCDQCPMSSICSYAQTILV